MFIKNNVQQSNSASVDLRTPRSTFDTFCRAVLRGETSEVLLTAHADLRFLLQRQLYQLGEFQFFSQLRGLVVADGQRLVLGATDLSIPGEARCMLERAGMIVGTAKFVFFDGNWLIYSLA